MYILVKVLHLRAENKVSIAVYVRNDVLDSDPVVDNGQILIDFRSIPCV